MGQPTSLFELTNTEAAILQALALDVGASPLVSPEDVADAARNLIASVPSRLGERLQQLIRDPTHPEHLLVSGLMTGDLPRTPADNTGQVGQHTLLGRQQVLLGELLGHLVGYEGEAVGALVQDLVPAKRLRMAQQSQGSAVELEAHTEQAFSELRPDLLLLGCLRGDVEAATYLLGARELVEGLSDAELDLLREPLWFVEVDESFRVGQESAASRGPVAILAGPPESPRLCIDLDLMSGADDQAAALIPKLASHWKARRRAHVLSAGQILFVDNRRSMHGRSPFTARFDGTDRFLVRSFVSLQEPEADVLLPASRRVIAARAS